MTPSTQLIALFENQADLLTLNQSTAGIPEAMHLLALWMERAKSSLSDSDFSSLSEIGGILYRMQMRGHVEHCTGADTKHGGAPE